MLYLECNRLAIYFNSIVVSSLWNTPQAWHVLSVHVESTCNIAFCLVTLLSFWILTKDDTCQALSRGLRPFGHMTILESNKFNQLRQIDFETVNKRLMRIIHYHIAWRNVLFRVIPFFCFCCCCLSHMTSPCPLSLGYTDPLRSTRWRCGSCWRVETSLYYAIRLNNHE